MSPSNNLFLASALLFAAALPCAAAAPEPPRIILLVSDLGLKDGSVAVCKGAMLSVSPSLTLVDLTHDIRPFDVEGAADAIGRALPYYPPGTVVSAWVDPGTGGTRRAVAVKTKAGRFLVGPDNGVFSVAMDAEGVEAAVELTEKKYFRDPVSPTFHARDVFAPAAAHLASGVALEAFGPPVTPIRLNLRNAALQDGAVTGEVRAVEDPFGNVVTNIPAVLLAEAGLVPGTPLEVVIGERTLAVLLVRTFADVPQGEALALVHDRGVLAFAVNQGDFAAKHEVGRRDAVTVRRKP